MGAGGYPTSKSRTSLSTRKWQETPAISIRREHSNRAALGKNHEATLSILRINKRTMRELSRSSGAKVARPGLGSSYRKRHRLWIRHAVSNVQQPQPRQHGMMLHEKLVRSCFPSVNRRLWLRIPHYLQEPNPKSAPWTMSHRKSVGDFHSTLPACELSALDSVLNSYEESDHHFLLMRSFSRPELVSRDPAAVVRCLRYEPSDKRFDVLGFLDRRQASINKVAGGTSFAAAVGLGLGIAPPFAARRTMLTGLLPCWRRLGLTIGHPYRHDLDGEQDEEGVEDEEDEDEWNKRFEAAGAERSLPVFRPPQSNLGVRVRYPPFLMSRSHLDFSRPLSFHPYRNPRCASLHGPIGV